MKSRIWGEILRWRVVFLRDGILQTYEVRICFCEHCGRLAGFDTDGDKNRGEWSIPGCRCVTHDSRAVSNWIQAGSLNMPRTLQVLRSVWRVAAARLRGDYGWKFEIAQQCQELGGVYVKFLQMLAVHRSTKYLVEGMGAELAFEQVSYEDIDLAGQMGPLMDRFRSIESQPFAAGSYGQVYKGELLTGEKVIVKVLRPSLRRTLRTDLRLLYVIGAVTSVFTRESMVNFRAMAKEFARATWLETNYQLEAQNGERLRAYFDERGTLTIPRSYPELTSRTVLVQDYVGGVSIVSLEAKQREGYRIDSLVSQTLGSDVWVQLRLLGTELLRATVYADYLMVDPHPGNIRLLPDNRVALIDFGLISPAPTNRGAFATLIHEMRKLYEDNFEAGNFAVAMLAFFDVELHDALERVAATRSDDYTFSLGSFIDRFTASQARQTEIQHYLSDKALLQLFSNILNQDNKLGIRITEENALLQRSMTMFMSVIRSISDAHDERVYEPIIHDCIATVDDEVRAKGITQSSTHREMSEERAYEVASNWLALVAERDRRMYQFITKRSYA